MSSPAFALPLRLECRSSRFLKYTVSIVHALALLILLPLTLAWWIKLPALGLVLVQWAVTWRRFITFTAPLAVRRLVWTAEDRWVLYPNDGVTREARLLPSTYIHPLLVILRFRAEDKSRYAVILPHDSVDPDSHRRLRAQLRLQDREKVDGFLGK
jgi:toxin CptA